MLNSIVDKDALEEQSNPNFSLFVFPYVFQQHSRNPWDHRSQVTTCVVYVCEPKENDDE